MTWTHKILDMHGWVISTVAVNALVVEYSAEYFSSYASKQLQN